MSPPPEPMPDEQAAYIRYSIELFEVFGRWQQRAKWTGYTAAAVTFVVVLLLMSRVTENGSMGFLVALAAANVALFGTMFVVMPRLPGPSLRCPYCAGRVPVIAPPKGFAKVEHMAACPSCRRDLPVV